MGSTLSYVGAADVNALDDWITSGFIQQDGAIVGLEAYDISFSGNTLFISVIPEPGTYALLAGCFGLTAVMLRRRR